MLLRNAEVIHCLKLPALLGCPFPGPLARESRFFLGLFLSAPVSISRLLASLVFNLRYIKCVHTHTHTHIKFQGTQCYVISWVLNSLACLPSLHLSETYACFAYNVQGYSLYLTGRIEKNFYSIIPGAMAFFFS